MVVETRGRWLIVTFDEPCAVLSWAIVNGGWQQTRQIAWLYLEANEIAGVEEPADWLRSQMHAAGLAGAVGLMTSRRQHAYVEAEASDGDCVARSVATMGFSNALRVGDPSGPWQPATINLLVHLSTPLTTEAALETLNLLTEAKTLATLEQGIASKRSGEPATGTGTDYMVLAWPLAGPRQAYGGKHTAVGAAAGKAALAAMRAGIPDWKAEQHV
ncbi:adenosylcobinamide amidohydrolase [Bryobacter aggregatus]|uniref:adenosylcobinamide amidohydrolase n=1 Tax=Bryobacter aggregatus TaxID=360054 RepID=UPI00056271A8|nr:adenosylcobinamide amidohydrolase [Bryobacter aggregatus]